MCLSILSTPCLHYSQNYWSVNRMLVEIIFLYNFATCIQIIVKWTSEVIFRLLLTLEC